jgi:hypothetical protein
MRVRIDKAVLKRHRACTAAYTSVEWDEAQQALIYNDWEASIARLLSSPEGVKQLEWLVAHKLVPMTEAEFSEAKSHV